MKINTNQLINFMAASNEKSFTKAAANLFISVPSLKSQMDSLEKELNVQLFFRTRQGIQLTEEGKDFLAFSKKIMEELDSEISRLQQSAKKRKQTIAGCYINKYIGDPYYYEALEYFQKKYPEISIYFKQEDYFDTERYDVFIGQHSDKAKSIRRHLLCKMPLYCIMQGQHPLASKQYIHVKDLIGFDLLLPPKDFISHVTGMNDYFQSNQSGIITYMHDSNFIPHVLFMKQFCIIIGQELFVPNNVRQIQLEGCYFDYYIYSYDIVNKPHVQLYVNKLQEYYKKACPDK